MNGMELNLARAVGGIQEHRGDHNCLVLDFERVVPGTSL